MLTPTQSACVTPAALICDRTPVRSPARSGKSRWQWESTSTALQRMGRAIELQLTAKQSFDASARQCPALVILELHPDALHAVAVAAGRSHPHHAPGDRKLVRIIHQADEHENLVADLVAARGRDENAAAFDERHIRRIEDRLFLDVQGNGPRPWSPGGWIGSHQDT